MARVVKCFVDSNIFLYEVDPGDARKSAAASALLTSIGRSVVISTQVLQEFYNAATRKIGLSPHDAEALVENMARWKVVPHTADLVKDAIRTSRQNQMSLWDALIVEAAVAGGCKVLLTEDLNHGQIIRGIRVENPFLQGR